MSEDRFALAVVRLAGFLDMMEREAEWEQRFPTEHWPYLLAARQAELGEKRAELRSAFEQMLEP